MVKNLTYQIGSICLGLVGSTDWEYYGQERFQQFLSSDSPQVKYYLRVRPNPIEPINPPIFETDRDWLLFAENDRWVIWIRSRNRNPSLVGRFSLDYHSGEIFITKSDQDLTKYTFPLNYPLGELVMINLLSTGYGIMLHSCAVIDGEEGIVFAGYGSAGKSTTSRLWGNLDGVKVLNDDHTILRKMNGKFQVYSTPWPGQGGIARPGNAPLKKILIIRHAQSNQAVRLSPIKAAAELLVRTFAPHWNAPAMAFTLQFLDELCQTVPCYELGFIPDQSVVEFVRCLPSD